MSVIASVLALASITIIIWFISALRVSKRGGKIIPGPRGIPLIGHALELKSTTVMLKTLLKYARDYGGIVKVQIGPTRHLIVVTECKLTEKILSSTKILTKSNEYDFIRPWLGNGLLTSDGNRWKKHRRILTPAFHFQILEQFVKVFESCGTTLVEKCKREVDKDSVDIYPFITLCALDIISESIMGVNINAQGQADSNYVHSVKEMGRIIMERVISPIEMYHFLFPYTKNYYTQKKVLKILHDFTNDVIAKRREELEDNIHLETSKKPFLDILLKATIDGRPLTQEQIREEVDTFMFEGHDTTASAITFTLYCLAHNADVQKKAYEEQLAIFGETSACVVTYAKLQEMKYLDLVIKETLRLYPSVPLFGRKLLEDFEYDSFIFPKGFTVALFPYGLHRNREYFDNPEEFRPSRFNTIDGKLPYAYIPFSAGSRNCIGQKFAVLEMKSTVSKVLRYFELLPATPEHKLNLAFETILKSVNGVKIGFKPRC